MASSADDFAKKLTNRTLQPAITKNQTVTVDESEAALTRIRTAISRHRTSRNALEGYSDAAQLRPGQKTDAETIDEIEEIIGGLRKPNLDFSGHENTTVIVPEDTGAADEARWVQSQIEKHLPTSERTHPSSLDPYAHHVKDLQTFSDDLKASRESSIRKDFPYTKVEVLVVTWERTLSSDIYDEVEYEVAAFTKLMNKINYKITPCRIPSINSQNKLQQKVLNFLDNHENDLPGQTLFIIYYNGHGSVSNKKCYWHQTNSESSSSVEWTRIQDSFEPIEQDVLFILDCCAAGSAALYKGHKYMQELLAACSSKKTTPAGDKSFTMKLVSCFETLLCNPKEPIFPAAGLYRALIGVSQENLPLHVNLNNSRNTICLKSLAHFTADKPRPPPIGVVDDYLSPASLVDGVPVNSAPSTSYAPSTAMSGTEDISDLDTQATSVEPEEYQYDVLIAVKLKENCLPHASGWRIPRDQVEGVTSITVLRSKSTLLLVTLPVCQWVLLRDDPAYTFIDFVARDEKSTPRVWCRYPSIEAVSRTNSENSAFSQTTDQTDFISNIKSAMHDFVQQTNSSEEVRERKPGKIVRTCQHIADKVGFPSRTEPDPTFGIAKVIAQHLVIERDQQGEVVRVKFDLKFSVLVERMMESGKKSLTDAIDRRGENDGDIKEVITAGFEQLKKEFVDEVTTFETEKLTVVKTSEKPKSALRPQSHTQSRSSVTKQIKFESPDPINGIVVYRRTDSSLRVDSMKSKGPLSRTDSGRTSKGLFGRRFFRESRKTSSPLTSPRASTLTPFSSTDI